jgi:hypothetical protein
LKPDARHGTLAKRLNPVGVALKGERTTDDFGVRERERSNDEGWERCAGRFARLGWVRGDLQERERQQEHE